MHSKIANQTYMYGYTYFIKKKKILKILKKHICTYAYSTWWGVISSVEGAQLCPTPLLEGWRKRWYNFFANGHRCGVCHNASDAQVRNKRVQYAKMKNDNDLFLLNIYLFWCVFCCPLCGSAREALYVAFGPSHCDWYLLLSWVTLLAL